MSYGGRTSAEYVLGKNSITSRGFYWKLIIYLHTKNQVLDVGCGEGQIIGVLCQPAPWLTPPPPSILPPIKPSTSPDDIVPPSPIYNDDEVPNLHIREIHGLDVSAADLAFAVSAIAPPNEEVEATLSPGYRPFYRGVQRWEELLAKVWKGGLEVVNEEFIDVECIVSTEV